MLALKEVQPKFGADNQELQALYANGIVPYGAEFDDVSVTLGRLVDQTRVSERTPIMSVRRTEGAAGWEQGAGGVGGGGQGGVDGMKEVSTRTRSRLILLLSLDYRCANCCGMHRRAVFMVFTACSSYTAVLSGSDARVE